MGNIPTSARDPIFWLHHANIDRLWTVWTKMGGGRKNPPPASTWAQRVFKFDKAGQMTKTAGEVVDSEKSLNYRYDDESPLPAAPPAPIAVATAQLVEAAPRPSSAAQDAGTAPATSSGVRDSGTTTVSSAGPLSLGDRSVVVDMKLSEAVQTQLQAFATSSAPPGSGGITNAWLVLENVEIGRDGQKGGFSFSIKAMLPDDSGGSQQVALGQLGTFTWPTSTSALDAHDHGHPPITLTIPLKDVLEELNVKSSAALAKGLRVVFQAVHREEPASKAQYIKIEAISIKTTTAPLQ
jgi:hypothetical protein